MAVIQAFELERLSGTSILTMEDVLKSYNAVAAMAASELELELYLRSRGQSVF